MIKFLKILTSFLGTAGAAMLSVQTYELLKLQRVFSPELLCWFSIYCVLTLVFFLITSDYVMGRK